MAYCPPDMLEDVADIIAEVRGWAGVVEKKRLVFYVGRQPFLHFHLLEGRRRRADIKGRSGWTQVDLPQPLPARVRRAFLTALRTRHAEK